MFILQAAAKWRMMLDLGGFIDFLIVVKLTNIPCKKWIYLLFQRVQLVVFQKWSPKFRVSFQGLTCPRFLFAPLRNKINHSTMADQWAQPHSSSHRRAVDPSSTSICHPVGAPSSTGLIANAAASSATSAYCSLNLLLLLLLPSRSRALLLLLLHNTSSSSSS